MSPQAQAPVCGHRTLAPTLNLAPTLTPTPNTNPHVYCIAKLKPLVYRTRGSFQSLRLK